MDTANSNTLDELVRAGALMSQGIDLKHVISALVEQTLDVTRSDLACLYVYEKFDRRSDALKMAYKRGRYAVAKAIPAEDELVAFMEESKEAVVLLEKRPSPFSSVLMNAAMESGIALPLGTSSATLGFLLLNSCKPLFYNREKFNFLNSFTKLAGGMLLNARLYENLKDYTCRIEELERYQESIFSSMTNLLIATDSEGRINYFNKSARDKLDLTDQFKRRNIEGAFARNIDGNILSAVKSSREANSELLGIEGIFFYENKESQMDFLLNISPLKDKAGKNSGQILLLTDQTRERELEEKMERVVGERRIIKDMFSRYLSAEIVQTLVNQPDMVRLGGDKKEATIFFADIRGYTSFSEGKDPKYVIEVLNEYFQEAVEIVVKNKGYIDKFIGDCIMAAWGVPLQTSSEDAFQAVSCALQMQKMVASENRKFFRGEAADLKIGIGMHTGPLVAGNLGSTRRMNYTVIGDTVNVAARLEGLAGPGEIIITETVRNLLDARFDLDQRGTVSVKGIAKPVPIFSVKGERPDPLHHKGNQDLWKR